MLGHVSQMSSRHHVVVGLLTHDSCRSSSGNEQTEEQLHCRALACSVWTEKSSYATIDTKVDAVQGKCRAVTLREVDGFKKRRHN